MKIRKENRKELDKINIRMFKVLNDTEKVEIKRVYAQLRIILTTIPSVEWKEHEYLVRTCGENIFQVLS